MEYYEDTAISDMVSRGAEAIVSADWHLDQHAWADRRSVCGDSILAFQFLTELARKSGLILIGAGDLLDKRLNVAETVNLLRSELDSLGVVLHVQGQHDLREVSWLKAVAPDHSVWLPQYNREVGVYPLGPFNVWGIDWTPSAELPARLEEIPEHTDILVLHQVCSELMGKIVTPELSLESIPHATTVIVGDYHVHKRLELIGATGQTLQVLSPGSTNLRAINEPAEKFCYVLFDDGHVESIRIPSRRVLSFELRSERDLSSFVESVAEKIAAVEKYPYFADRQHPLLRVKFDPALPEAYARIMQAVGRPEYVFTSCFEPEYDERREVDTSLWREGEASPLLGSETTGRVGSGLLECLPDVADEENEPEVFQLCRRLLDQSDDPRAVLDELRKGYFVDEEQISGTAASCGASGVSEP